MGYKILVLLLVLVGLGSSYSSLTMQNCPAQFNVTSANTTSSTAAANLGSFLYSAFQTPAAKARVQAIVITGNTNDLSTYISEMMVPYIIFGVVYIVFYLIVVALCLF